MPDLVYDFDVVVVRARLQDALSHLFSATGANSAPFHLLYCWVYALQVREKRHVSRGIDAGAAEPASR